MLQTQFLDSKSIEKNMKQFHRNEADISSKTGKKGHKLKKNHSVETCKCVAPFVKLHWWDCPEVKKQCPIHENVLYQKLKPEKVGPNHNVTVSFQPSSRTEKLFEPIKTLLAQCDPETKINFQYYSPRSFTNKENLKQQLIQTSFEDIRKSPNDNAFVEKTKSFTDEKTSKMKKLNECFHSPCNSIAQKYPSPTSVKRNINEVSSNETWHNFFKSDRNYNQNPGWFSSNGLSLKNLEKLSGDKKNSDFITVTQHNKDNVISHKIFEIKHRKGLNEIPIGGCPTQPTQFAYSSFNVNYPNESQKNYNFPDYDVKKKTQNIDENTNSDSQTSTSTGSVYVTPFLLVPPGVEFSDTEIEDESGKKNVASQVEEDLLEERPRLITKYVKISHLCGSSNSSSEQKINTVSLQTDPLIREKYSESKRRYFQQSADSSVESASEKYSYNEKISVRRNCNDDRENERTEQRIRKEESKIKKTTEVQTSNRYQFKEVLITRYNKEMKEASCQAQSSVFEIQETGSQGLDKSLMTSPPFSNKKTQTDLSPRPTPTELSDHNSKPDQNSKPQKVTPLFRQIEPDEDHETSKKESNKYYFENDFSEGKKDETLPYENTNTRDQNQVPHDDSKSPQREALDSRREPPIKEDNTSSAISDLSELKKIIYEFFEKVDSNLREKHYEKENKQETDDAETMADSARDYKTLMSENIQPSDSGSRDKPTKPLPKQLNVEIRQYRQSVLLNDGNPIEAHYICSLCGRKIIKLFLNVATNTEKPYRAKEKTTIIETDYVEITKVKKSKDPKNNSKSDSPDSKPNAKPFNNIRSDSPKPRNNIPVSGFMRPGSVRNENKSPFSRSDSHEWAKPNSANNFQSTVTHERQHMRSQPFKECVCNELPEVCLSTQEPGCSQKGYTQHRTYGTDDTTSQVRNNENLKEKKDDERQKQPNRQFYHVFVNSSWPEDFTNSWKAHEIQDESLICNGNRKICNEKSSDQCSYNFPKRNFEESEESQKEINEFENSNFSDAERSEKQEGATKENCGFNRMPSSSASQISPSKGSFNQCKVIKSEESVKVANQQFGSPQMKIFGESSSDIFTVKSCNMRPMAFASDRPSCDKLLGCSVCKSLVFLKINSNDDFSFVTRPNGAFPHQNDLGERSAPTDDVSERRIYDKSKLLSENIDENEEENAVKRSNHSNMITRGTDDFS